MPSGNLPALNFLGDGQRTTGEFQSAVNELQNYVVSLKNEVDALSDTVAKEAMVRSIGSGAGNVPDTAVLNTRLGTTENLSLASGVADGSFNPESPNLVWSGQSFGAVNMSELSESGVGFYWVRAGLTGSASRWGLIYIGETGSGNITSTLIRHGFSTSTRVYTDVVEFNPNTDNFDGNTYSFEIVDGTTSTNEIYIYEIRKV